jgi:hypothetical protein
VRRSVDETVFMTIVNKNAKIDVDGTIELSATSVTSQIDSERVQHVFVTDC